MDSVRAAKPVISIVIRCFNEEAHIGRLLSGIMEQSYRDVEIIIVDSGSTDRTVEIAKEFPIKLLHIKPEDFSFGRSLNIGCNAADGEFIVIASAHVYPVYDDWLTKLIAPFSDPKVALAYGKQRGTQDSHYSEGRLLAKWFPDESNKHQTHPFCNNANAIVRRELWDLMPYDEELTGVEDTDWAARAIGLGYHLAYVADALVIHNHKENPRRILNRYKREAIAIKNIFPQENLRWWDACWLFGGNVVSDYYHSIKDGLFWRNILTIPTFRSMQFWGAYRGFAVHGHITSKLKQTFYYPSGLERPEINDSGQREGIDYPEQSVK